MEKNIDKFTVLVDFQKALKTVDLDSSDGFRKIFYNLAKEVEAIDCFFLYCGRSDFYVKKVFGVISHSFLAQLYHDSLKKQIGNNFFLPEKDEFKNAIVTVLNSDKNAAFLVVPINFNPSVGALIFQFSSKGDGGKNLDLLQAIANSFSDYYEKRHLRQHAKACEDQIQKVTENVRDIAVMIDERGVLSWSSKSLYTKTGYQQDQLSGKNFYDYIYYEDIAGIKEYLTGEHSPNLQKAPVFRLQRQDGSSISLEILTKRKYQTDNSEPNVLVILRDINDTHSAEKDLRENQRMLQTLMANLSGIVYRCKNQKDWPMEFISEGCVSITGYSSEEFVEKGMSFSWLIVDEDRDYLWKAVSMAVAENRPFQLTYRIRTRSGQIKWIWEQGRTVIGGNGHIEALEGVISDITHLKNTEFALRESQAKNEAIIKALPDNLLIQSQDEIILDYYASKNSFLGLSPQLIIGRKLSDVLSPALYQLNSKALRKVINSRKPYVLEFSNFFNGKEYFFESRMVPFEQDKMLSIIRDITLQKVTEQSLRENEEKYRLLFSNEKDAIALFDLKTGSFIEVNNAWLAMYGYDTGEVRKLKVFDSTAEYKDTVHTLAFLEENESLHIPSRKQKRKNGTTFLSEITSSTFILKGKKVVCSIIRDISERARTEEILKESEDRYRRLIEHSPLGVLVIDNETIYYVNKEAVKILGASDRSQLVNLKIDQVYHPKYLSILRKNIQQVLDNNVVIPRFAGKLLRFDGKEIEVEATGIPFEINNKLAVQFIFQDVTDKKQNEKAVKETQARLETIFENIPFDFWVLDKKGKYIKQNNVSYNHWGKLVDNMPKDILVPKKTYEIWKTNNERAFKGEVVKGEVTFVLNNEEKTFFNIIAPVYVGTEIEGIFGINIDITDRKRMEQDLEKKTGQLTRINKDLENFAYIASHDLKSPVLNLRSLLSFYNKENPLDEFNKVVLEKMEISVNQLNSTLEDLLKIIKHRNDENTIVQNVVFQELFQNIISAIETEIDSTKAIISTDFQVDSIVYPHSHMKSILQNYLVNAIKYSAPKNQPEIRISTYKHLNYVCLEVEDNGLGINLNLYKEKVFGLYKRFHENIKGNGLGLYLVKSQVESLGGKVDVESEPGVGSSFKAYLIEQKMD